MKAFRAVGVIVLFAASRPHAPLRFLAKRSPWFFSRFTHDGRFRSVRRGKDRQEHQLFRKGIIRPMHFAHGNKSHLTRLQDAMLFADPLLGLAGNNEDQLFASWMIMKRM